MNKMEQDCDNTQTPLLSVQSAIAAMLEKAVQVDCIERRALNDALGYVLAHDIQSCINVPPADNSAMDGYAFRYADLMAAENNCLAVSQRICAGQVGQTLDAGSAARIFTGAAIPSGCRYGCYAGVV